MLDAGKKAILHVARLLTSIQHLTSSSILHPFLQFVRIWERLVPNLDSKRRDCWQMLYTTLLLSCNCQLDCSGTDIGIIRGFQRGVSPVKSLFSLQHTLEIAKQGEIHANQTFPYHTTNDCFDVVDFLSFVGC